MTEFEAPQSRNEALLQNILGAENELEAPQSRNEKILHAILGEDIPLEPPQSRIEELLLQIKEQGIGGVTAEPITITQNGEYTAEEGKAYTPVTVAVPTRDPNLYEKLSSLQLSIDNNTWTDNPTITIDCAHIAAADNMCSANSGQPGYKKVILKNIPSRAVTCQGIFGYHSASSPFDEVVLDGDLICGVNAGLFCFNNKSLKKITGGRIDLSASTSISNFARGASALVTISFVPSCIKKSITFDGCVSLSTESVISICNGLDGTVTGQTLTLDSTIKAGLSSIIGTVTDGIFVEDAGGDTNLLDFATITKGWTLA